MNEINKLQENIYREQTERVKRWHELVTKVKELKKIKKAAALGVELGLEVHAGHGLTFKSAKILSKIPNIKEFNIGHFLIGESIFEGLAKTIRKFKLILKK